MAHRHSVPSGDGGQLAEGVTNITGGALNEVLTNDGTDIPIWAAVPVASGGNLQYIGTTTALVVTPSGNNGLHLAFTAIDMTAVTELIAVVTAKRDVNSTGFLWNSQTSGYSYGGSVTNNAGTGTAFGNASGSLFEIGHWASGTYQNFTVHFVLNEGENKTACYGTGGGSGGGAFAGGQNSNVDTEIDSVSFVESGRNMPAGNHRLTVYKVVR